MVDYSMDDNTWNTKKMVIDEWFDANPDMVGRKVITDGLFAIGDGQPDLRKKHWSSISGVFADLANSPIGGGRKSLMTTAIKSGFDMYKDSYYNFMYDVVYDTVQGTAKTHGKSGGVLYRNMENGRAAFASEETKKEALSLSSWYNNFAQENDKRYRWDGTFTEEGYPAVYDTQYIAPVVEDVEVVEDGGQE